MMVHAIKLSVSLPKPFLHFVETYQTEHACESRSEVIKRALKLLQEDALAQNYRAASHEVDSDFEITTSDGLDNETW